jgi:hypothetical protein
MLAIPVNRARIISVRRRGRVCHELERWNPLCCLESHLSVHNSRLCHLQVRFQDRVGLHHSLADLGFLRDLHLVEASWGADLVDLDYLRFLVLAQATEGAADVALVPDVALAEASWVADLVDLDSLRALHLAEASWGAEWVDLGLLPDVALLPMTYPEGVARGQTLRCDQ